MVISAMINPFKNLIGDDYFDETLEFANEMYQLNYRFNVTGTLDTNT